MNGTVQEAVNPKRAFFPSLTPAELNFWRALALGTGLILFFQMISWLEQEVFHLPAGQRLVRTASEAAMRYFALAHYFVALFFMMTAARNRTPIRRGMMLGLLLAGGALCGVYHYFGGYTSGVMSFVVYGYFLVHEMRDDVLFYTTLRDAPPLDDRRRFNRLANGIIALVIIGVLVALWFTGVLGWYRRGPIAPHLVSFLPAHLPWDARLIIALAPAAAWLFASYVFLDRHAAAYHSIARLIVAHALMLRLFAGAFLVLGLGVLLTNRPYALILLHVSVWYVFVLRQLKERQQPSARTPQGYWIWMRTTAPGFRVLHIGMFLGLVAIDMIAIYGFGGQGWLWYLLAPQVFLYWTILHITVSFIPRGDRSR
jgi:hypothetical protein